MSHSYLRFVDIGVVFAEALITYLDTKTVQYETSELEGNMIRRKKDTPYEMLFSQTRGERFFAPNLLCMRFAD